MTTPHTDTFSSYLQASMMSEHSLVQRFTNCRRDRSADGRLHLICMVHHERWPLLCFSLPSCDTHQCTIQSLTFACGMFLAPDLDLIRVQLIGRVL
jgi:hypothetical protein